MINKLQAGFDAVDYLAGMKLFKNLPITTLWNKYYSPLVDKCTNMLREPARKVDFKGRSYGAIIADWQDDRGGLPTLPDELLEYFPGRQPVLNYMWRVMRAGSADDVMKVPLSKEVKNFFKTRPHILNAIREKGVEKLPVNENWIRSDEVKSVLREYLARNREMVWTMLYGVIPDDL
jgi:hypothetical protein